MAIIAAALLGDFGCGDAEQVDEVRIEVDFSARLHDVGKIVGWNIGAPTRYAPESGSPHPEWRTPDLVEAVRLLAEVRAANGDAPIWRFSGLQIDGANGDDGYHYYRYVDPDHEPADTDNMASMEYFAMIEEADADAIVTVNFGSGTAAEAADYAIHLNGESSADAPVAARAHWGHPEPYGQTLFEIGNEVYEFWNTGYSATGDYAYASPSAIGGGDPAWHGRPSANAADYAARALEYVTAIRQVTPEAQFFVPLTQSSMDGWGGYAESIPALAPLLEDPAVRSVVIHQYPSDDGVFGDWVSDFNDVEFLMSSAALLAPEYEAVLSTMRSTLDRDPPPTIAVTEYHVAAIGLAFRLGDSPVVGLSIADQWLMFADLGVEYALQHMSLDLETGGGNISRWWHIPFQQKDGGVLQPMPGYHVARLLADHLLRSVATVHDLDVPVIDKPLATGGVYGYRVVHATAFVNEAGTEGTLVVLHRDQAQTRRLAVALPPGANVTSAQRYAPPSLDWSVVWGDDVVVEPAEWKQHGTLLELELPPHSLVALRFALPGA